MGVYLNSGTARTLYKNKKKKPYFIDKSLLLEELFPFVKEGSNYICITRPRRFGKTVMANMIAAFFSNAHDTADIFGKLQISKRSGYQTYLNRYPVIHIPLNDITRQCASYEQYITRIETRLIRDLKKAYPHIGPDQEDSAIDMLTDLYAEDSSIRFIFILDEWDFIFHQPYVTETEKKAYLSFLRSLLKDRPYVQLAYMTGILPIAKYSSGSELNMFMEYTMATEEKYSTYFGFTEKEVDILFERYQKKCMDNPQITRAGLKTWYDGYHTKSNQRIYNPRSVIVSLTNNNLGNYWTSSGPYDEIFYYIKNNIAAVREDLVRMISGVSIPIKIREYTASSMSLQTKDEIFSAMVVYGFLTCEKETVCIPNKELMEQFSEISNRI